ncbi:hypothetical protein [Streptomyces sp. NPDC097619]|uniref:hypothetical protein n=1 Tax=Streptomyces sp. NPDC097619 TaxID=3157228 RepID=UPI00332B2328
MHTPRALPGGTLNGLVGRYFAAVSVDDANVFRGAVGFWRLGDPCAACAVPPADPAQVVRVPCRNPRGHAHAQVKVWLANRHGEGGARVLAPVAPTREEARRRIVDMCERIRVVGHL